MPRSLASLAPARPRSDGMRVLVTADAVGGVWTYALDLARGLVARGDEVALAVLGPSASASQRSEAEAAGVTLEDTGLPLDWTAADEGELAAGAAGLAEVAERRRTQVVHLSSPALAGAGPLPGAVVGVAHSCLATWWSALRDGPPPADFAWRIAATARGYQACDALIAPSAAFARATADAYGVSPLVVCNGRSRPSSTGLARDIPIATAGRLWDEGKGAAILDAAAAVMETPILAIGPVRGPQGQAVVLERLTLAGSMSGEAVTEALSRTRIFVSAARYEPFGLAVLEAAQGGCALVLSDIPTFRELWEGAAVFVPPGDAARFAAALQALLRDDTERERLAHAARIRADRYDLDRFVDATRAVHRAALRRPSVAEAAA